MPDTTEFLGSSRTDAQRKLAALIADRTEIERRIEFYTKKIEALETLIRIEETEKDLTEARLPLLSPFLPGEDIAKDEDGNDDGKSPRSLGRRWQSFAYNAILSKGPQSISTLYHSAPAAVRNDFEASETSYPPLFRARRFLRRDDAFIVDRSSGLVSVKPWPAPPPMPTRTEGSVMLSWVDITESPPQIHWYKENPYKVSQTNFDGLVEWIEKGNFAWIELANGKLHAVTTIKPHLTTRIESFDESEWTNVFDRLYSAQLIAKLPPEPCEKQASS